MPSVPPRTDMDVVRVLAIHTFPVRGEPPVDHASVRVTEAGLDGDRTKRAAVSLVGADSPSTRANLVLDAPTEQVESLDGSVVRVGEVLLAVRSTGTACRGLYAAVSRPGSIRVGDIVQPQ